MKAGVASFEDAIARMSLPESGAGATGLGRRVDESALAFFNRLKSATDEQLAALYVGASAALHAWDTVVHLATLLTWGVTGGGVGIDVL